LEGPQSVDKQSFAIFLGVKLDAQDNDLREFWLVLAPVQGCVQDRLLDRSIDIVPLSLGGLT
jgi:hypothetical protein